MQTIVTPGWEIAEDISQPSDIVSLQPGVSTPVLTITIPGAARLLIESLTARVIDAGSDQIYFQVLRNGMGVAPGFTNIPGVLFDYTAVFSINKDTGSGSLVVMGVNNSAAIIRATAALKCYLLRQSTKEKQDQRYIYERGGQ